MTYRLAFLGALALSLAACADGEPLLEIDPEPLPETNTAAAGPGTVCWQDGFTCACGQQAVIQTAMAPAPYSKVVSTCQPPGAVPAGKEWTCDTWSGLCRCMWSDIGWQGYWNEQGYGVASCP